MNRVYRLLTCLAFLGCNPSPANPGTNADAGNPGTTPGTGPGRFALSQLGTAGASSLSAASLSPSDDPVDAGTAAIAFDFGELKGSHEFFLLLQNSGGHAITDVAITSSNAAFIVSPSSISVLDIVGKQSITPLVSVGVVHGLALEGVGYAPLLPMGVNEAVLTVSGSTVDDSGDAVAVSAQATVRVFARVMAFTVSTVNGTVDLSTPHNHNANWYLYLVGNNQPSITNTGNVDIIVTSFDGTDGPSVGAPSTIHSGDTTIPAPASAGRGWAVSLNGNGVVADYIVTSPATDGQIYLGFLLE